LVNGFKVQKHVEFKAYLKAIKGLGGETAAQSWRLPDG
jgi:hypothetical protein